MNPAVSMMFITTAGMAAGTAAASDNGPSEPMTTTELILMSGLLGGCILLVIGVLVWAFLDS